MDKIKEKKYNEGMPKDKSHKFSYRALFFFCMVGLLYTEKKIVKTVRVVKLEIILIDRLCLLNVWSRRKTDSCI